MYKAWILILSLNFLFNQDVILSIDCPETVEVGSEGNLIYVFINNDVWLNSFQIDIPDDIIEITNIIPEGNYVELYFFYTDSYVFWFNLLGVTIPPNEGGSFYFEFTGSEVEEDIQFFLSNVFFSGLGGELLDTDYSDTCTFSVVEPSDCPDIIGDINFDDDLNILDIVIIIDCILDPSGDFPCECANANGDGVVNVLDVILILSYILYL